MSQLGDELEKNPHQTLLVLSALLRHQDVNPYATALTMTRRYELDDAIGFLKTRFAGTHVDLYAAPLDHNASWDAGRAQKQKIWRRFFAVLLFEDWDSMTEKYASRLWLRGRVTC